MYPPTIGVGMQGTIGYTVRAKHFGKMEFTPETFEKLPISENNDMVSQIRPDRYAPVTDSIENDDLNLDVICKIIGAAHDYVFPTLELAPGKKAIEHEIAPGVVKTEYPDSNECKTLRFRVEKFDYENPQEVCDTIESQLEVFGLNTAILADVFPDSDHEVWNVIATV